MLLYYLKTSFIWLLRCGYSRGFGVHSPSAYSFIRYVINEHNPYYAYEDLKNKHSSLPPFTHKMGRLFFRLANYCQPICCFCDDDVLSDYAHAGCRRMKMVALGDLLKETVIPEEKLNDSVSKKLVLIDAASQSSLLHQVLEHCDSKTLLVITSLPKLGKLVWKSIQSMEPVGRTFNLYYYGIIFFDRTIYKQHYQVNF